MAEISRNNISCLSPNLQIDKIHLKDYGAKKLQYANDIALVELLGEVDVTSWALPVCVDWALELPDLRDGQEGTVSVLCAWSMRSLYSSRKSNVLAFMAKKKNKKQLVS